MTFALGTDEHTAWLKSQTTSLLVVLRTVGRLGHGGFDELSSVGSPFGQPKPLFLTARMTYGYALGHLLGIPVRPDSSNTDCRRCERSFTTMRTPGGSRHLVPTV